MRIGAFRVWFDASPLSDDAQHAVAAPALRTAPKVEDDFGPAGARDKRSAAQVREHHRAGAAAIVDKNGDGKTARERRNLDGRRKAIWRPPLPRRGDASEPHGAMSLKHASHFIISLRVDPQPNFREIVTIFINKSMWRAALEKDKIE